MVRQSAAEGGQPATGYALRRLPTLRNKADNSFATKPDISIYSRHPSRETRRILAQAKEIGPVTEQLCQRLFDTQGRVGQRSLWGIVGLAKRYPRRLIEHACTMAMHESTGSYKQIKTLTERLLNDALTGIDAPIQGELALTQDSPLIRSGEDYADLFTLGAQSSAALPPTLEKSS